MIYEEYLLKILCVPHSSEKVSAVMENTNTLVMKVAKNANKLEIKTAVQKIFNVEVKAVNTMLVKGKTKRHRNYIGHRSNWKKAYVTLKKGANLDFINRYEN